MTGIERIAAERQRQIDKEGWTPEHDDDHEDAELAMAAACYASAAALQPIYALTDDGGTLTFADPWPFELEWDKRSRSR